MLLLFNTKRSQRARNRQKAEALVAEHGDAAMRFVEQKIASTMWQIRDHAHWTRVEKQVKSLLGR